MWSPVAILAQYNFWVGANFCAALPMADPIAIYRQQQAAARAKLGEGVEVETRSSSKNSVGRRPSRLANLLEESPPMSPATEARRASKEKKNGPSGVRCGSTSLDPMVRT